MVMTTGLWPKLLWPGLNAIYGKAYADWDEEWSKIFTRHSSDKAYEEDLSVSSFGLAQEKGEGLAVSYDNEQQGFVDRYQHATLTLGFSMTKELFEDKQYDVVGERKAKGLARSMRHTKEIIGANILNRAFNTSFTYGDGKALVVSDHPNVAGGTWSNVMAVASDLSEAALETAFIDISKWTDDRGLRIAVKPKGIIIPTDLDFEAHKILETQYEVGTANNTVNVVRGRFPAGIILNHYLTDTDAWFITTNVPNGLKYFSRVEDQFSMDDDFDTDNAKYKARARYSFGCSDKKSIYGTPGV